MVGEPLVSIGNPNLRNSSTVSRVDGIDRPMIEDIISERVLVHSPNCIGGYSGGPAVDGNGDVVAINFFRFKDHTLAMPSAEAIEIVEKAKDFMVKNSRKRFSMTNRRSLGVILERRKEGFVVIVSEAKKAHELQRIDQYFEREENIEPYENQADGHESDPKSKGFTVKSSNKSNVKNKSTSPSNPFISKPPKPYVSNPMASIAVISGHYWRRRNVGQNESNEWTNARLRPELTLKNASLNGTDVRDHFQQWHRSVVSIMDSRNKTQINGSGFVVERGRYVVTTALAVCGYNLVMVRLSTGVCTHRVWPSVAVNPNNYTTVIEGKVVYRDPMVGLALIKFIDINADAVPPLPVLGPDLHTVSGQRVVVLGMPDQKRGYVTGAISCPNASFYALNPDRQFIDHNIESAPDYNGGPVLDMNGQVVGVLLTSSIFIVKTADLRDFIQKGLAYETQDRRNRYSFEGKNQSGVVLRISDTGIRVVSTKLRVNDQITHINGIPLLTIAQLTGALDGLASGAGLPLTVLQVGQPDPIQVEVRPRPLNFSMI
ncbi:unnamed protein product [Medioppia subpectinata]|uniref:PDZ domain-containing protein n=1 Tax=Medioppia subpectinata TaxID=1979941 RepID=A0A7R9KFL7_9ACAR|nr:unnamed protein product [Medioppia subpectinata]CAG2102468.1 unnamed protein product [Medioppia subpectinata]